MITRVAVGTLFMYLIQYAPFKIYFSSKSIILKQMTWQTHFIRKKKKINSNPS